MSSMQISIDISLYPLAMDEYKQEIWQFIDTLRGIAGLKVVTNGMSTQVFGDYDLALNSVMSEMKKVHQATESAVFILKVIAADRDRSYQ